ncbi:glutamic-type intramembrane protease PrsW [Virgibacillus xinjiangensis]|uniref:Protease PrsW n=1 Tax=Virgibacillus xinjiangensis TaxID=393090 RepID=A0ABV7CR98_9BACI
MFAIFSAGLAPAMALMSFFYLKDRFTEPLHLIIRTFVYGALLVFPIMFIQYVLQSEAISNNSVIESFLFVAFFEEFFKWFIFIYTIYHHSEFDQHYDGIVYGVAISLGFASVENILYLITNGLEYAVIRAVFPVSSHALFGVIMGYHLGLAKVLGRKEKGNILLALLLPILLHGTYNYILDTATNNWLILLIPFMMVLWFLALRRVKSANAPISVTHVSRHL